MDKTTLGSSSILGIMYVSFLPMYLRTHIHVCLQTICTFNDKSVSNSPYNRISIVLGPNPHITTDITGKYSYQHSFFQADPPSRTGLGQYFTSRTFSSNTPKTLRYSASQ